MFITAKSLLIVAKSLLFLSMVSRYVPFAGTTTGMKCDAIIGACSCVTVAFPNFPTKLNELGSWVSMSLVNLAQTHTLKIYLI